MDKYYRKLEELPANVAEIGREQGAKFMEALRIVRSVADWQPGSAVFAREGGPYFGAASGGEEVYVGDQRLPGTVYDMLWVLCLDEHEGPNEWTNPPVAAARRYAVWNSVTFSAHVTVRDSDGTIFRKGRSEILVFGEDMDQRRNVVARADVPHATPWIMARELTAVTLGFNEVVNRMALRHRIEAELAKATAARQVSAERASL